MKITNIGEENIGILKNRNIYIYGAGEYAHDVSVVLQKYDISVNGYIVDDLYYTNREGIIKYSDFKELQDVMVINGIANVATFKKILELGKFTHIYTTFGLTKVWKFEKEYFKNKEMEIEKILDMFCDELSRDTYKNYLHSLEYDVIEPIIETADMCDIYFNSLTSCIGDGAFIDCGAFNGDTVAKFNSFIKNTKSEGFKGEIFAFEPDRDNYRKLISTLENNNRIKCLNKGVWDKKGGITFSANNGMGSCFADNSENIVEVTDIDSVIGDSHIAFIKMDVEGAEYKALLGAHKVIERDYPILAISAYHRMEDLIELPKLIKKFENKENGYRLYLRHHGVCPMELVIYGIPYRK